MPFIIDPSTNELGMHKLKQVKKAHTLLSNFHLFSCYFYDKFMFIITDAKSYSILLWNITLNKNVQIFVHKKYWSLLFAYTVPVICINTFVAHIITDSFLPTRIFLIKFSGLWNGRSRCYSWPPALTFIALGQTWGTQSKI